MPLEARELETSLNDVPPVINNEQKISDEPEEGKKTVTQLSSEEDMIVLELLDTTMSTDRQNENDGIGAQSGDQVLAVVQDGDVAEEQGVPEQAEVPIGVRSRAYAMAMARAFGRALSAGSGVVK
jgi:hypothetical protein